MGDADAARLNTARGNVIKELIATERDYVKLLVAVNRELLAQLESAIALCPDEPHKCLVGKPLKQMVRARSIQRQWIGEEWSS